MGTHRRPKGSYVRNGPDFFIERTAMVGGTWNASPAHGAGVELFNNATDGSYLHVYGAWAGNDAAQFYGAKVYQGNLGSNPQTPYPVVAGRGTPPGILYAGDVPPLYSGTLVPNNTFFGGYVLADNEAGNTDAYKMPGPICVLPPGYAFQFYSITSDHVFSTGGIMAVTFYYLAITDQG